LTKQKESFSIKIVGEEKLAVEWDLLTQKE